MNKYVLKLEKDSVTVRKVVDAVDQEDANRQGRELAKAEGKTFLFAERSVPYGDREPLTGGGIFDF